MNKIIILHSKKYNPSNLVKDYINDIEVFRPNKNLINDIVNEINKKIDNINDYIYDNYQPYTEESCRKMLTVMIAQIDTNPNIYFKIRHKKGTAFGWYVINLYKKDIKGSD